MAKRTLQGTVVRDSGDKTLVVCVERRFKHPMYKKFVRRSKTLAVHDPENQHKAGDQVRIRECRPISKRKTWEVVAEGT